ncbi:murein hydrolase activator EnvC family protein [Massilia aquatica]|uniref:Peptidoglycan DD-metalloendopeptidase family protein n=1 Tax=Massilia aquatica TaxID=2609000 RepID=A0ABX0MMI5_9BURK|nr:peptidoglycan DD-metalloendopeptidase family protein [Massilia aquatica]NHZ44779.1 peptidoglycan DD-metalloendopeptidase family protein [Massilia aquatica]
MLLAVATCGAAPAPAPRQTERSKQKVLAEKTRAGIQQKLAELKREVSKTESEREDAADTLAESEEAISNANRVLRELASEQSETSAAVAGLAASQEQLAATIVSQKQQLSRLLREQYVAGNEDRIKLLLSGDNPNRINRDLQLMAYVSKAQARLLASLHGNLAAVASNRDKAENAREELDEIAQEEREQKAVLVKEKARRAALLGSLSERLTEQRKEIGGLERDEQRMAGLVDKLSKLIKEQAEAAAAEQRRQEALAAARAKAAEEARLLAAARKAERMAARKAERERAIERERERLAREAAKKPPKIDPRTGARTPQPVPVPVPVPMDPIDDDEAPVVAQVPDKPEPPPPRRPDIALAPATLDGAFASLRGKLRAPVSGKLAARFGAKRGSGPSWKGMFIKAAEGSEVRAVAGGRVVFARWMRGFGNLILVDHGTEYLSVYGNNQALLKREGDAVKGGEPIASAGNTGGNEESGLYFEIRHKGAAVDPAGWVNF